MLYVTILAGGAGKRMKSDLPKVLHLVKDKPMIVRLLKQVQILNPDKIIVVVGRFHQMIQDEIERHINDQRIIYVDQETPLGTGHAVKCTLPVLGTEHIDNIILNGDVPMIQHQTIREIYNQYLNDNAKLLITAINLANPTGNGRIIIDDNEHFKEIVEEKDCSSDQKLITLVNCGIYVCSSDVLTEFIPKIQNGNSQGEYYLTDLVKLYVEASHKIGLYVLPAEKEMEIYNINTKEQLYHCNDE